MKWQDLTKQQRLQLSASAVVIVILFLIGIIYYIKASDNNKESNWLDISTNDISNITPREDYIYVEIVGFVKRPGVYELPEEILIIELLEFAGGLHEDADLEFVHKNVPLATKISDGQKIFIPPKTSEYKSENLSNFSNTNLININTSTVEELMTLSGVGQVTAEKIIEGRPYSEVRDLLEVSGIGESIFNKIVSLISV